MDNFEPIDVSFLINSEKVSKDAASVKKDITGVAQSAEDTVARANKSIANTFVKTDVRLKAQQKQLINNKRQWNGLGNSINQLSREIPAFSVSAQTGFLAISNNLPILADEIAKLRKENDLLKASGQKGVPVWKQLVKGLFSWQTVLSVGVALLTVYGKELVTWTKALFKGKDSLDAATESKKALNKAFESSDFSKVVSELLSVRSTLNSAKKGFIDKEVAVKQYNKTLGDTLGKVNSIAQAEKNLNAKAGAYVQAMLFKTAATLSLKESAAKLVENARKQFNIRQKIDEEKANNRFATGRTDDEIINTGRSTAGNQLSKIRAKLIKENKLIKEAEKQTKDALNIADGFNKKVSELSKKFNLDLFSDDKKKIGSKGVNDYKNLLQKIADLDKEFARKSLTENEAEIQALKDKFAKMRKLIEAYNLDPKNKAKPIDVTKLDPIENRATEDVVFRQGTDTLKKELADKKQLFIDFEEFKKQFGITKAREKFQAEIGEFESYLDYVTSKVKANQTTIDAVGSGSATGGQKERASLLLQSKDTAEQEQNRQLESLLASLETHEEKRLRLIEDYQQQRSQLIQGGFISEAVELEKQHQENLNKLDAAYAKGTPQYKALIDGVTNLSTRSAKAVIANARKMVKALVAAGKLSADAAQEINNKIDGLEAEVKNRTKEVADDIASKAFEISGAFGQLSNSVRPFNEDLANSLETVSDLAAVAGDAAKSVAGFASGEVVSGITGAIGAISGILSIAAKSRESERKAREEIRRWHQEIFISQLAYNSELRNRIIDETRLNDLYKSRVENINEEYVANKKNAEEVLKDQQKIFSNLLLQETTIDKTKVKSGGFLGIGKQTKVVDVKRTVAELIGAGSYTGDFELKDARFSRVFEPEDIELTDEIFEKLEKINGEKPLTDDAKTAFEELQRLRDEYGTIAEAQKQLEIQKKNIVTATTAQGIADSLSQAALEGRDTFQSVSQDIEGFLRDAIIAGMNTKIIEPEMQKLQDKLYEFLGDGILTENEKDDFQQLYANVSESASAYLDLVNQTGVDLFEDSTSALRGGIGRQITEETGSEITGLMRGQFDITSQHFQLAQTAYDLQQRGFQTHLKILQANEETARNTGRTAEQLVVAVAELREIKTNTSQSQSSRDRGV